MSKSLRKIATSIIGRANELLEVNDNMNIDDKLGNLVINAEVKLSDGLTEEEQAFVKQYLELKIDENWAWEGMRSAVSFADNNTINFPLRLSYKD
ncbi:hypothetical protein ACFL29_00515 [Patescibacteria group bacterium]